MAGSESLQLTGLDLQPSAALPELSAEQRSDMFARFVEPSLQRELKHNGTANGDGSDSAELIGHVELVGPKRS